MIDKDTRTGPIRKYVMWSLYPVLCTLSSVICTLSSVLYFLPSRGQGRDNSICSANEYRGQGRDNTEDKIGGSQGALDRKAGLNPNRSLDCYALMTDLD